MFPKEILEILEKYQENNKDIINDINLSISDIILYLGKINENITKELQKLLASRDTVNTMGLYQDSVILGNYINSISTILISNTTIDNDIVQQDVEVATTIEQLEDSLVKPVKLYLSSNNICPKCDCEMEQTKTCYTVSRKSKTITSYRCSKCKSFFVIDFNIKNISLEECNIELITKYYDKILLSDILYVVNNINFHSTNGHILSDKMCILTVIQDDGNPLEEEVIVTYCETCNKMYLLKEYYDNLHGTPVCAIIDETKTIHYEESQSDTGYANDSKGSKLTRYGYNVNCIDKLTDIQRRKILTIQLLSKNMERNEIVSIIESDIQRCETSMKNGSKRDLSSAIQKWREDKRFVEKVVIEQSYDYVGISKIILQYNRYI